MDKSRKSILAQYNQAFESAKETLNERQRTAVDQIYGPVMTVAGPGTGKTQLLAVRIGNILQQTDVNTSNILCLTFTDSGSIAMRERLKGFIGPEAYNANIFTFHSFCNYVIQENIQFFGGFRNLQLISELELVDVYHEIIDAFADDHPLKRFKGNLYYELDRLKKLFNIMKQEKWSAEVIEAKVRELEEYYKVQDADGNYINAMEIKSMVAGRKTTGKDGVVYLKGELRMDKLSELIASFDALIAGSKEMVNYQKILARMERYDYNDMILWVIDAFRNNDELLAKYQERFQFLLVDEYQDTNGAQNELLFLLADNPVDDKPNVFIVGDDDQSIYRFQGANMNNIIDFANKYDPTEIVLENNYRSDQRILDWSKALIENNNERLVRVRPHLTKELIESRNKEASQSDAPRIFRYKNMAQEEIGIINDIMAKHEAGVPLNEIAIIYRMHKNVENIVKYLTLQGVPLNIKRKVDVLKEGEVKRMLAILRYLMAEYEKPFAGDKFLFEIMHYEYFNITAMDVALVSVYCSRRTDDQEDDRRWRTVISDVAKLKEAGVSDVTNIVKFSDALEQWIKDIPNVTAQVMFERILTQGGILDHILASPDKVWRLQLVNTFFNFIKEESSREENISMPAILEMIDKMDDNKIPLPLTKIIFSEKGIHFLTAHGSKGLEFQHVYIIRCDSKNWVAKNYGQGSFKFPATLVPASSLSDIEDDRRLFYVAMTRARDFLTMTYADFGDDEKALEPTRFLAEISSNEEETTVKVVEDDVVLDYKATLMRFSQGEVKLLEKDQIDKVLQTFKMSTTSLNKYIKCPITFYFENILRVPMARSASNGFGNAIHYALEMYFREMEADPQRNVPEVTVLLAHFHKGMKIYHSHFTAKERELSMTRGDTLLLAYHEKYQESWILPRSFEMEFDIKTEYNGVPISGKLDQVAVYDDHLEVIDYKTGRYDSAKLKGPTGDEDPGGDYWRQIVFYKLLLSGDDRLKQPMRKGVMDFVEAQKDGRFQRREFTVEGFEIEIVGDQLKSVYNKIKNHEFDKGCGDEKCKWCNFVNENMPVSALSEDDDL